MTLYWTGIMQFSNFSKGKVTGFVNFMFWFENVINWKLMQVIISVAFSNNIYLKYNLNFINALLKNVLPSDTLVSGWSVNEDLLPWWKLLLKICLGKRTTKKSFFMTSHCLYLYMVIFIYSS